MRLPDSMLLCFCLPLAVVFLQPALALYNCSDIYDRVPDNSDLMVDCGTSIITLDVNLCTAEWAGFNATGLALNGEHSTSACLGTVDAGADPPVIRYQLPVNHSEANPCRQSLQIVDEVPGPSSPFSSFSNIQSVIITGFIETPTSNQGVISYATDLYYHFSCRYPLEYLLNNTQIMAGGMRLPDSMLLCFCLPLAVVFLQPALALYNCSDIYDRVPDNSDLMVDCGTSIITLDVNLCTAEWAGFNATGLALNGEHSTSACLGTVDAGADPPVIRYQLPVNHSEANPCRQSLQIVDEVPGPSSPFSSFSNIQSVIITGFIETPTSNQGVISYATDLYYHFSCRYPLEYLLNNTQIMA
ncbi:hypothetical protein CRUP_028047 [Coryphaenoides rupestris]|nr:hypothetical protein CRUP_028047 [Coryphaenoides rupestris]